MPDQDDTLLARLNALKPSSVTLNTAPSIDIEVYKPTSREDKLSERLRRLRDGEDVSRSSATPAPVSQRSRYTTDDELPLHALGQDDQSIDDLLAELEGNEQARLDPNDPKDIRRLMEEARNAFPAEEQGHPAATPHDSEAAEDHEAHADDEALDEQEAHSYIQQVLAELEVEKKYAPVDAKDAETSLPSTPADIPVAEPPTYEDSELEARFSKLALGLPSTPKSIPASKPKSATTKAKSKPPTYTDEDIDSWCCICNEDGELRCIGCDGDIYCQKCWNEGHGRSPGQEQGHKAVLYVRKGGGLAAAD